ncbi:MAG TPA: LUD domain-containing protein [Ktedonosporobacter sp.]|jgi:iron-sulfur cluster protein|nr:LUD domain-containing protein [Ktedonosporobacter sp.]
MTTSDSTSPQQNIEPFITDDLSAASRDSGVGRLDSKTAQSALTHAASPQQVLSEETANPTHEHQPFDERLEHALDDEHLRAALGRFAPSWRASRLATFAAEETDYGPNYSFTSLRSMLRQAKDYAIEHQPELIAQFKTQAEAAGAIIYEARTAEDANRYIYELCRDKGIELVVKSKTMVSEETELNAYLEARGVTPVETDLGEWVAQLDHERPSHMVMPIIHKTRQQVGTTLTRATGREISRENVAEQVAVIRVEHRKSFLTAGMGISGANALIAESGTVMMITNEGNGRLVTSLPPVHVVMAGYDKLIGTFAEAMTQLRLLARSATAQHITSYTTFITGPATPGKEMHIVLVDNGRSAMRADPRFKEALRCIRCAACANVCPPYQQVGGHAFGHIYSGAIGLVVTPFHHGIDAGAGPQSLCVSCNACETVCPVEIPLPSLILDVRHRAMEAKGLPRIKKLIFSTMRHPRLFGLLTRLTSIGQLPITRGSAYVRSRKMGLLARLPIMSTVAALANWRSLPAFAVRPLRDRVRGHQLPERSGLNLTVCYFAGCMTDRLYPEMGEAVIKVLESVGVRVVFPQKQNCCGLPALNSGDRRDGVEMAKQTIVALEQALSESNADYILSASTSCVVTIVQDYLRLFEDLNEQRWLQRTRSLAEKVIDFTGFMARIVLPGNVYLPIRQQNGAESVTYHDSCQSCNCLGLRAPARQIIKDVLKLDLREMPQSDVCCGFGGSASLEHPRVAQRLLDNKLNNAVSTGATILVADNPGCLMHLRGGVDASARQLRVLHLAELIAERLP